MREEIEETMTLLVDDRMSFFLKKNFYSKNLSTLIENTENINFQEISRKYGVLVEEESDPMFGAALRGIFIIDENRIVRSMQINDDSVGRSVDETLRLIKGFQFADKNGQVCPANWQPGEKTIIPN